MNEIYTPTRPTNVIKPRLWNSPDYWICHQCDWKKHKSLFANSRSCLDCKEQMLEVERDKCRIRLLGIQITNRKDPKKRVIQALRGRLSGIVRGKIKGGSAIRDLGCTVDEFFAHIESLFRPGMSWENYGNKKGQWNIDHIMPISLFDGTNPQHVVLVCHYLNLRPLWHSENVAKLNKIPTELLGYQETEPLQTL